MNAVQAADYCDIHDRNPQWPVYVDRGRSTGGDRRRGIRPLLPFGAVRWEVLEKDYPLGLAFSVISRLFAHTTQARSDFSKRRRWLSAMRWRAWIRCVDTGSPQSKQG